MDMKKKNILWAALLLLAAGVSAAAQEKGRPMSLHDCMSYAVSNSTKMRIREAELNDARIERRAAVLSSFLPSISGSSYAYYNFGRSIDPQTNTYFTQTSFHNSYSLSAGITLFDGFSAVNNMKITGTSLLMGHTMEEQAEADICLAVMEAYCNAVYYGRLKDIQEEQKEVAAKECEKARFQEELGQKGHADVVQLEASLADSEYDLTVTRNSYVDHLSKLADLMFWPVDEPLVLDMDFTEEVQAAERIPEQSETVDFARASHPDILLAQGRLQNARTELNTARWRMLPKLDLYGGWSTNYYTYVHNSEGIAPFASQFKNNGGEYVELSLSIPIFSPSGRRTDIARKRNAVTRAGAEYDQKMHDIESEVARAYNDYRGAEDAYAQACRKAELQEEAFRLNTRKMEQGLISTIEHKTSANAYLRAMADRLNSRLQMLIKGSVVRYYNGENYIEQF